MQAWLELIPEKDASRNGDRHNVDLPEIQGDYAYLVEWLHAIGTVSRGFESLNPLPFAEIEAWSRLKRIELSEFEAMAIRSMSAAFVTIANNPKSDCPSAEDDEEVLQSINEQRLSGWFALANKG